MADPVDWPDRPVTVRVPATSANLGPGFDALGLCLDLTDEVSAEASAESSGPGDLTSVVVHGEGAETVPTDDRHLVAATMRRLFAEWGLAQPRLRLTCRNTIPHGRGLGSSAAAIVAGALLARELAAPAVPAEFDLLSECAAIEGHADNVAACLLGGLVVVWEAASRVRAVRLRVDPRIRAWLFCANEPLPTEAARRALPPNVPHADAAANTSRAALLIAALTGHPELLLPATEDWLHQPYRRSVLPEATDLVDRLRADGIAAVLSGAGPSVLVLAGREHLPDPWPDIPAAWRVQAARIVDTGARIVGGARRE